MENHVIIQTARNHYHTAVELGSLFDPSNRWWEQTRDARECINGIEDPPQVIHWAQNNMNFDHRTGNPWSEELVRRIDPMLKEEFPQYSATIDKMGESPYSDPGSCTEFRGRQVSNILYWHLRHVLMSIDLANNPDTICDIGGGYGETGRMWLSNSAHQATTYIDVDLPESLYLAEVFLRVNFPDLDLLYVTSREVLSSVSEYSVVLCPTSCAQAISQVDIDIVTNTGSIQEMPESWVNYWMGRLSKWNCRYFYSLNYFAQPLADMTEAANIWSPVLPSNWIVRYQKFNPPVVTAQSPRRWAEIFAENTWDDTHINYEELIDKYRSLRAQPLNEQTFLEAMDIVRLYREEDIMWDLLQWCMDEFEEIPKEVMYLVTYLGNYGSTEFRRVNYVKLMDIHTELLSRRRGDEY